MRHVLGWEHFEEYVNNLLGLRATIASGSKSHDPGDGVDPRHPSETDFALMVDAKYTEKSSFGVVKRLMRQWTERAMLARKRFVLVVRLADVKTGQCDDYAVMSLDDFVDLWQRATNA